LYFYKENYEFNTKIGFRNLKRIQTQYLDVRTEDGCNEGIIENAITIDIHQGQAFINAIEQLDKTKTIMCTLSLRCSQRKSDVTE
jgi:hypothetical protein